MACSKDDTDLTDVNVNVNVNVYVDGGIHENSRVMNSITVFSDVCVASSACKRTNQGASTSATMLISLIRMFMDGPAVSLNGSPTVSPTMAALCAGLPLPPCAPCSMYFLALSHAPPEFAMNKARSTPVTVAPASTPPN